MQRIFLIFWTPHPYLIYFGSDLKYIFLTFQSENIFFKKCSDNGAIADNFLNTFFLDAA